MEITEFSWSSFRLSKEDRDYLLRFVRVPQEDAAVGILESLLPTTDPDVYQLRAGPYVGRLALPSGRFIDFRSRFPFDDFVELIRFSAQGPVHKDALRAAGHAEHFFIDGIAAAFAREVDRLLGLGLAKGYKARRFTRPPYPGTIDAAFHLGRLQARQDRLATVAKRLTHNIPVNQALALALDVLRRVPLDEALTPRLTAVAAGLRSVDRPPMSADDVYRIPLTRLTAAYGDALGLAELILRSESLAPRNVEYPGASILFYMPKVWEACVLTWVRAAWPDDEVSGGFSFPLSSGREIVSIADVVVRRGSRIVALYDAKYKQPQSAPSPADVYQMVTYCERLRVPEATLVYPTYEQPRTLTVGNIRVQVVGVRFPQFDLESTIRDLAPPSAA